MNILNSIDNLLDPLNTKHLFKITINLDHNHKNMCNVKKFFLYYMCKYLHENNCKWDEFSCSQAAHNNSLECLKYLHENGYEWNEDTCICSMFNNTFECLRYVLQNGSNFIIFTFFILFP